MSMLDLSNMDIENANDMVYADANTEHEARIIGVVFKDDKNEHQYALWRFDIPKTPEIVEFTHFMHLPNSAWMDESQYQKERTRWKIFAKCFGIDFSQPLSDEEVKGKMGWVILGYKEDPEYGPQNYVKKFSKGS